MIYILYQDAKGWKVARSDYKLDEFTRYYSSKDEAIEVLDEAGIRFWLSEIVEHQKVKVTVVN